MNFSGQWQDTPDYREGWTNKHSSAFGGLLSALDPMTYIPGVNAIANPIHQTGDQIVTGLNTVLSPVVGAAQTVEHKINPVSNYLNENVAPIHSINEFAKNKPVDTLALLAATFFSGGAAGGAMGAGEAAAAPAASGGVEAAGGMASAGSAGSAAITPAFESGAAAGGGYGAGAAGSTTGSLVGANAITPTALSGYGGISGAYGAGTLGAAGTESGMGLLGSSISQMPTGFGVMKGLNQARDYYGNLKQGADTQQQDQPVDYGTPLGQAILNDSNIRPLNIRRITNQLVQRDRTY